MKFTVKLTNIITTEVRTVRNNAVNATDACQLALLGLDSGKWKAEATVEDNSEVTPTQTFEPSPAPANDLMKRGFARRKDGSVYQRYQSKSTGKWSQKLISGPKPEVAESPVAVLERPAEDDVEERTSVGCTPRWGFERDSKVGMHRNSFDGAVEKFELPGFKK